MIDRAFPHPGPARIVALRDAVDSQCGGKANGLAQLLAAGLKVPEGFAIVGARAESLPPALDAHYAQLGAGPVAVRSSALGEDSHDASYAGQYDTLLGVDGPDELRAAIVHCLQSLTNTRAAAYREAQGELPHEDQPGRAPVKADAGGSDGSPAAMCVVVQRMVDARAAGVAFTVDPVSQRRAHSVVDAIQGLGESLVDGSASPDHYLLDRDGALLEAQLVSDTPVLDPPTLRGLLTEALRAEAALGMPLDLEWAIDQRGELFWLQARPITTLGADPNELDTPLPDSRDVLTRCNVGEMFPGAATPLSISFTGRAIDVGLQKMQVAIGILPAIQASNRFIAVFYGHLFLNLTTLSDTSSQSFGSTSEQLFLSVCGRRVDEVELHAKPPPPLPRRLANSLRYLRYVLSQRSARRRIRQLVSELRFSSDASPFGRWQAIDSKLEAIERAMHYHLISSAGAGILTPTLLGVVSGGKEPNEAHHAEVAALLSGAEDVESADIVAGAERIQRAILAHPDGELRFIEASLESAARWLEEPASQDAGREYRRYLVRHGHRAVRELELRQKEWAADPAPLLTSIQVALRARKSGPTESALPARRAAGPDPLEGLNPALRLLVRLARGAVKSREETKSALVAVTTHFKVAYRELAEALVREGRLPDPDALFFLTHSELGELSRGPSQELTTLAVARREVHELQMSLAFPEVCAGVPEPILLSPAAVEETGAVNGTPVSRGQVIGRVRIVRTLEDAQLLRAGEILIAPVTDVGWTPYFSLVAGLVTDIGSAVSHGAVVAREYRLPAVVNTRVATQIFATGDLVRLDGDSGVVSLIPPDQREAREATLAQ